MIFHADNESQDNTDLPQALLAAWDPPIEGATEVCWDNAAPEAFFASLKRELVNRYRWLHRVDALPAIVRWIEGWYNARRLHFTLHYRIPVEAEDDWYPTRKPLPHEKLSVKAAHSGDSVHPVRGFSCMGVGGRVAADAECGFAPGGHLLRVVEGQSAIVPVMVADEVGG